MRFDITWSEYKTLIGERDLNVHHVELSDHYRIFSVDGTVEFHTVVKKRNPAIADQTDFETNYKPNSNVEPLYVATQTDKAYTEREKKINSNVTYYGRTKNGALTSEAKWQISRIVKQGTETIKQWADGDKQYDNVWDNYDTYFPAVVAANQYSTYFDGINDYINFGDVFNYDRSVQFSFSIWVRFNNFGATRYFLSKFSYNTGNPGFRMGADTNGKIITQMRTTGQAYSTYAFDTVLSPLTWYHIVWTYDGSSNLNGQKIYINGTLDTFTPASNTLAYTMLDGQSFELGRTVGAYFVGHLDEMSVYNVALSQQQVTEIYNSGSPLDLSTTTSFGNCDAWIRMGDDDIYPTVQDNVNSNNGTMTNMVAESFVEVVP